MLRVWYVYPTYMVRISYVIVGLRSVGSGGKSTCPGGIGYLDSLDNLDSLESLDNLESLESLESLD